MPTGFAGLEVWYGQMAVLHVPKEDLAKDQPEASKLQPPTPHAIGHSGSDGTAAWAWPERDLMVLFFTQSRGSAAPLRLEEAIERLLLNPGGRGAGGAAAQAEADVPERFKPMLGTYIANFATYRNEEFRIILRNGGLALDIPSQMVFELIEPEAPGKNGQEGKSAEGAWKFAIAPETASVSFAQQEDGVFKVLRIHQRGQTFDVPRRESKP